MTDTTRLGITLLEEGQRSKEAAINDALNIVDAVCGGVLVIDVVANLPSATDNEGALAIATDVGVSDETWLVYSNGTNWYNIVQVNGTLTSA